MLWLGLLVWGRCGCYGTGRMPVRFMRDLILNGKIVILSSLFVREGEDCVESMGGRDGKYGLGERGEDADQFIQTNNN